MKDSIISTLLNHRKSLKGKTRHQQKPQDKKQGPQTLFQALEEARKRLTKKGIKRHPVGGKGL